MKHKHALVACARWDSARIAEWLSYHRAIGYDHAYLYCNDDDPAEFVDAILPFMGGRTPFVTYYHCRVPGMQRWMYLHCLETHGDEFEWVSLFDIDEFLSVRGSSGIDAFVSSYPADTDCLYVNWSFFGHGGFAERAPGSVLLNYTHRQQGVDPHTKTITRRAAIRPELIRAHAFQGPERVRFNHGWDPKLRPPMMRCVNVLGDDMGQYYDAFDSAPGYVAQHARAMFDVGVLHHYAFQSEADFERRLARGANGDHSSQRLWRQMLDSGDTADFLDTINAVEDTTLRRYWLGHLARSAASSMILNLSGPNVALGKACAQSSAGELGETADAAVSGAIGAAASFATTEEDAPWWQVDLGRPHAIDAVLIFNRLDGDAHRSANIQIWLSDGEDVWRHAYRKDDGAAFGGVDGRPLVWRPPEPAIARLVRISLIGHALLHLNQVEICGAPIG